MPTRTPLPVGGRGCVAITLRDGSIVLEGQATIVSTAQDRKRKGMTLRFSTLDGDSRALLDHLDRERFRAKMTPVPGTLKVRPGPELLADARAPGSEQVECVVVGKFRSPDDDADAEDDPAARDVDLIAKRGGGAGAATDTVQMWKRVPVIARPVATMLPTEPMSALAVLGEPPALPAPPALAPLAPPALAPRPTTPAPEPPARIAVGSRPLLGRSEASARDARHAAAGPTAKVVRHGGSFDDTDGRPMWIPIALVAAVLAIVALVVYIAR